MNEFNPKEICNASKYLKEKLDNAVKQSNTVYKMEEEAKGSKLKQFVNSIFKR